MTDNYVFSKGVNALSIGAGLSRLGLKLTYLDLQPVAGKRMPAPKDSLFFTEESSLKQHIDRGEFHFYPKDASVPVDDKLELAILLRRLGEQPVPFWPLSAQDGDSSLEFPLYLKARHSWIGDTRLPRGVICTTPDEFTSSMRRAEDEGLELKHLFLQRLVPAAPTDIYSVCGFFDAINPQRHLLTVTRRLLGDGTQISTSRIVETVADPGDLLGRTRRFLSEVGYRGPFELEFIFDRTAHVFYVLEFNPRFWLQHGLFIDGYGNRLIKFYLDLDTETDWYPDGTPFRHIVWLDRMEFLAAIAKRDTKMIRRYRSVLASSKRTPGTMLCFYPDWPSTTRRGLSGLRRRLSRRTKPSGPGL